MNVYVYAADLYCEACGEDIREELRAAGKRPETPDDEVSFDSDNYPKGPYPDGGGVADSPRHCVDCGRFLENALTAAGEAYVAEAVEDWLERGTGNLPTLQMWVRHYGDVNVPPEFCVEWLTGRHVPNPKSITPADRVVWVVGVRCLHCGQLGAVAVDPEGIQW